MGMLGTQKSRAETEYSSSSSLASQLQQAWLQSQIQSSASKLQKRAGEQERGRRASNLRQAVSDHYNHHNIGGGSGRGVLMSSASSEEGEDQTYFHKSRINIETPEFLNLRPSVTPPQLVSYSRKADLPPRSVCGSVSDASTLSSLSSPRSGCLSPCSDSSSRGGATQDVVDCGDSGDVHESLFDGLVLMEENLEDVKSFGGFRTYQAMAKEFDTVVNTGTPESLDSSLSRTNSEFDSTDEESYDISWTTTSFSLPTEEDLTDKLIHAYTCNLSKHVTDVTDVTENVDSSSWVNEQDTCTDHSDSQWDYHLERLMQAKPQGSRATLISSSILQNHFFSKDMSLDAFSFTPGCVDLKGLLLRCALVVSQDDMRSANDLIRELRHHSSAYGNSTQRMVYYYMEALVAKMSGTGAQLYTAISSNTPSSATMMNAHRLFVDYSPYTKISHFFSTKTILDAFEGAERVHLVDYGVLFGAQWPCLIQRLSQRREGPPHLRITCIDLPQPGGKPSARVEEVGRRLAQFAKLWDVPFEFQALADKWETITPAQLCLKHDEVLAVHCQNRLRNLLDESIMAASPRKIFLDRIRSMNPKVFIMLTVNANYNAPFFMTRFRESMKHYSIMFDAMEVSMPANDPNRVILEKEFYGREILNIVACDGVERVERAEPYRQWQTRTQRAGFSQKPLLPIMMRKIQAMMGSYHKDYGIGEDGCWFLMGWKNQIVRALTVWEPTPA